MNLISEPGRLVRLIFRLLPRSIVRIICSRLNVFSFIRETKNTHVPISFDIWYEHKIKQDFNRIPWPVHHSSTVIGWENVHCGVETSPGYSAGNYISSYYGKIEIGDYTQIAPNVGIISANHNLYDTREFVRGDVNIGPYSWLGMGSIILPGVNLGPFTIVAAGAVVTKSFEHGYCVIGGNPAKIIKNLNKENCVKYKSDYEYCGYLRKEKYMKLYSSKVKE